MPVLLLCYGDPIAKDMLKRAIEARYGLNPPAIESLDVKFEGRTRVKIGPVKTWVPLEVRARFRFSSHMRLDFVAKPMGLPVRRGIDSLRDESYYTTRGKEAPREITELEHVDSARKRLWSMAATLLTPLSETFIKLEAKEGRQFTVTNTVLNETLRLSLRKNAKLESVQVDCLNPETNKQQTHSIRLSEGQDEVNGFMMPSTLSAYWDEDIWFEMTPKMVLINPEIEDAVFSIEDDQ